MGRRNQKYFKKILKRDVKGGRSKPIDFPPGIKHICRRGEKGDPFRETGEEREKNGSLK